MLLLLQAMVEVVVPSLYSLPHCHDQVESSTDGTIITRKFTANIPTSSKFIPDREPPGEGSDPDRFKRNWKRGTSYLLGFNNEGEMHSYTKYKEREREKG